MPRFPKPSGRIPDNLRPLYATPEEAAAAREVPDYLKQRRADRAEAREREREARARRMGYASAEAAKAAHAKAARGVAGRYHPPGHE